MDNSIFNLIFQLTVLSLTVCMIVIATILWVITLPISLPLYFLFSKDEPDYA